VKKKSTIKAELDYFKTACEFKDKLFSIIGHDLRSPLSSIKGLLTLLDDDELSQNERKYFIAILLNAVDASLQTLDNLLGWASQKSYGAILNTKTKEERINLRNLVSEVICFAKHHSSKKDIVIVNNVASDIAVKADLQQLTFVLRNIASNGIKFSYHGGEIIIEGSPGSEMVEIAVKDQGIGMSQQDIDSLFQIDKRRSRKGTGDEEGTGLGLIFCKEFIKYNGGLYGLRAMVKRGLRSRLPLRVQINSLHLLRCLLLLFIHFDDFILL
jgi:two-component system sensor histidine kinase/response regulator